MTLREFEMFTLVAALVAMSQQVRAWLAWPLRLLVVTRTMDCYSTGPVLQYLLATSRWEPRGGNYYSSEKLYIRPLGRSYRVFFESLKEGRQTFWLGRLPLWYAPLKLSTDTGKPEVAIGAFSYVRWTVAWDDVLRRAVAHEDATMADLVGEARSRFHVVHHGRSSGEGGTNPPPSYAKSGGINLLAGTGSRILHWSLADLAEPPRLALDTLSLRPELTDAADRVRAWIESKDWCEERGIPWRLGLALTGRPGTGKTSLARALAVEHNLPVHVFDIAALDNYTMRSSWSRMLEEAPCMALIEDIDAVFRGRERSDGAERPPGWGSGASPLTYDCLLNCISGIDRADGVLLVVTSNHAEHIDPAMMRRGRLDLHVEVLGIDFAGRLKMARRILRDDPALAHRMAVEADDSLTPADFQERCVEAALARHRGDAA